MDYITTNTSWRAIGANNTVSFQNVGAYSLEIGLGTPNTAPTVGFSYSPGFGDRGSIVELFPRSTGNTVWVRSTAPSAIVLG